MHREVLTKPAAPLFTSLGKFSGFYLAGGTALALQIGHRVSVDFDLFSDAEIKRSLLPSLRTVFPNASIAPLVNNADELTALVDTVKVTFLTYPFPTIDPSVLAEGVLVCYIGEPSECRVAEDELVAPQSRANLSCFNLRPTAVPLGGTYARSPITSGPMLP